MTELALAGDALAVLGFLVAAGILATTPTGKGATLSPYTKWLILGAFGTRIYVSATKILVYFTGSSPFEEFGDYIEVLFPVLVAMSVFTAYMAQQLDDLQRSQRAVQASGEMMLGLVDAAPAGIMLLDGAGHITFANESARDSLDLFDDPQTVGLAMPGVVIHDPDGGSATDFGYVVKAEPRTPVELTAEWPSGWRIVLAVAAHPLDETVGGSGGMVATFERPATGL